MWTQKKQNRPWHVAKLPPRIPPGSGVKPGYTGQMGGAPRQGPGFISEQPLLIGLARPAPCANFSRRSGRNPSEVCVEPQNRQRHYMASPIPKHAKYQPGCGPGNMILKHFLFLNVIKNPTIIRRIRTPPGNEPWATGPPRETSSPTTRMPHMK